MICRDCKNHFVPIHFNQKLCSNECKKNARIAALKKYDLSEKGTLAEEKWRLSSTKKRIDKKYYTSAKGRKKAVERVSRLLNNPYYLYRKRLSQTAPYKKLRKEMLIKFGMCFNCHSEENLTIDHIRPLSLGGKHDLDNLQVLCRSCNARKGQEIIRYELPKMQ